MIDTLEGESGAPLIRVLAGPTASGKSELAIQAALRLGAEIVSADSQQVYRYFDIGTAKPTADRLALVPHHLISVVEPTEGFSAAEFQTRADRAIQEIASRGKAIIIAGGTGLYIRALLHGLIAAPGADQALRKRLETEAKEKGLTALYQRLTATDPSTAASVSRSDEIRIIRALEILERTGVPPSEFRRGHRFASTRYRFSMLVLSPPKEQLHAAIAARVHEMFRRGLVEEVRSLVVRGFRESAPMRSVGYVQALAVVDGRMSESEAIEEAERRTRAYAKRQMTWFRREPGARFLWTEDAHQLMRCWRPSSDFAEAKPSTKFNASR